MVTVISEGSTDVSDISAILVGYFDCDKNLQSADDFYMLIVSVVEWLLDVRLSVTHPDDLVKTLLSISKAVNAMVNSPALGTNGFWDVIYPPLPLRKRFYGKDISGRDMRHPFYWYGDKIWLMLLRRELPLSALERATDNLLALGPLLHVIAEGFVKQVYFVAEEWPEYLHSALRDVHIGGGCSDENCRWASHDFEGHDHNECPLLVKNPVEVEANLSITNHSWRPLPFARIDTSSSSQLSEEEAYPMTYLNSVLVHGESRQPTGVQSEHSQASGGDAQYSETAGAEIHGGSGDVGSLSHSPPTHISRSSTLPLLSLEGCSDLPLFLGDNPRPPVDVPSTHERHEERRSLSEDHEPRDSMASTDIARDDPTNAAPVDSNNASVESLV